MKRTYPKEQTSTTFINLPDGSCKPVSTIYDVGGPNQKVIRHMPKEEWDQYQKQIMENIGNAMSYYYSSQLS